MKTTLRAATAVLAMLVLGTLCALPASAECGSFAGHKSSAFMQQQSWGEQAQLLPASFTLVSSQDTDPIVGFWKVSLSIQGQVIDAAYAQWHSDGTEIMNSSRPAATGNFCLGVWKRVNGRNYRLNHFALSWNPDGTFLGPAQIQEKLTLSKDAKNFSGSFTIDQYDPDGKLLQHAEGDVNATRINIHTKLF